MLDMWKGVPSNVRLDTTHQVIKLMSNKKEKKTISLYGLLNKLFKRNFLCKINFFRQIDFLQTFFPIGQKALQKTFATYHGKKSFAQIEKFRQIDKFFGKLAIFSSI